MAGVTGPLARRDKHVAIHFVVGLAAGYVVAGVILSLAIESAGVAANALLTAGARLAAVVMACLVLLTLDAIGRTPQWPRQVPVRLFGLLRPGILGFAWGLDLGILVTTRKNSSAVWLLVIGATLTLPIAALPMLLAFSAASAAIVFVRSGNHAQTPRSVAMFRAASFCLMPAVVLVAVVGMSIG